MSIMYHAYLSIMYHAYMSIMYLAYIYMSIMYLAYMSIMYHAYMSIMYYAYMSIMYHAYMSIMYHAYMSIMYHAYMSIMDHVYMSIMYHVSSRVDIVEFTLIYISTIYLNIYQADQCLTVNIYRPSPSPSFLSPPLLPLLSFPSLFAFSFLCFPFPPPLPSSLSPHF